MDKSSGEPAPDILPSGSFALRLFSGTAWVTLAGGIGRAFSLLASPILTRALGPAPYGVVALVWTVISLATTLGVQGIELSYLRYYSESEAEHAASVERFCWRATLMAAAILAIAAGLLWVLVLAQRVEMSRLFALVIGLGIVLSAFQTVAQTRARLRSSYRRIALCLLLNGAVSPAVSIWLSAYWTRDAWALLGGGLAGIALSSLVLGAPDGRSLLQPSGLDWPARTRILQLGIPSMFTGPLYWVISSSDRWFLSVYRSQAELGIYAFASSIGLIGLILNSSIILTWFPEVSRAIKQDPSSVSTVLGREWARLVTLLLIVWLAVSASGPDLIRLLAAPQFFEGARYVPWIAGGVALYGMASIANTGLFVVKDMMPWARWWFAGAVVDLLLNALLVPAHGAMGAVLASCSSYGLIAVGVVWSAHRRYAMDVPYRRLILVAVMMVLSAAYLTSPWHPQPLWSLGKKLPLGIVVVVCALLVMMPDWLRSCLHLGFRRQPRVQATKRA